MHLEKYILIFSTIKFFYRQYGLGFNVFYSTLLHLPPSAVSEDARIDPGTVVQLAVYENDYTTLRYSFKCQIQFFLSVLFTLTEQISRFPCKTFLFCSDNQIFVKFLEKSWEFSYPLFFPEYLSTAYEHHEQYTNSPTPPSPSQFSFLKGRVS